MAASFALLIVCLSFCDLTSMCVTIFDRGLTTPTHTVLLPFDLQTKSSGFHFLLWSLVYSIVVVRCVCVGVGMSI